MANDPRSGVDSRLTATMFTVRVSRQHAQQQSARQGGLQ